MERTKLVWLLGTAITLGMIGSQPAGAEPAGLSGSYAGATLSADQVMGLQGLQNPLTQTLIQSSGVSSKAPGASALALPAAQQYQGRLDLENSDLSVRGSLYVQGESTAIVPSVTYDIPVQGSTNVYAGAGYALINPDGGATPLGDRNGLVLSAGAESGVLPGIVVYGNAQIGVGTDSQTGNSPLRWQMGVGRRF
ncbi:hypothetical protein [Leptothoe sp. PORK10 BA2]|uniref:hypothetical protein n=1 Tax=Leptothoe sp. PORK10 BA2 TaxID=3110254 RepID=UPI002B20D4A1|nr:hypothetical protein [Leptothoe sp. PORK10 BA2]MEA5466935.1 hypothetical protein [Leptothoe sp. PORK10 BA2]